MATLEELSGGDVAKEHDEHVLKYRASLQGLIEKRLIDEYGEPYREWTVAELIEEAWRRMVKAGISPNAGEGER